MNMLYYTKYANDKFELLHKYKVFMIKETIDKTVLKPDKVVRKNHHYIAQKDDTKVIYTREGNTKKIITFYPVK